MIKRLIHIFLIIILAQLICAQYDRDAYYVDAFLGYSLIHDFTKSPMELYIDPNNSIYEAPNDMAQAFDAGSITMSDTSGEISFVTNICYSWTPDGQLIEGTEEVFTYGPIGQNTCKNGGPPASRHIIVLPVPGHADIYFYIYAKFRDTPRRFLSDSLFYRVLDMTANDGRGQMMEEENFLLADTALDGSTLAATRHANGKDWWLTVSGANSETYVLQVDSQTIALQDTFRWSHPYRMGLRGGAQATFSPNGDKYARADLFHGLSLADFDQATGEFSNIHTLPYEEPEDFFPATCGVAFSGNNRFLYVSANSTQLIQYDMEAEGLSSSDTLWEFSEEDDIVYDSIWQGWVAFYMEELKLGKDCKIYALPFSGLPFMHVVHNPNAKGEQALFRRADYRVPSLARTGGLGHHPHWRTATPQEDWCADVYYDSIYTSVEEPQIQPRSPSWQLSPNPARDRITITALDPQAKTAEIVLYDQQGRQVNSWKHMGWDSQEYALRDIPPGLYFVHILSKGVQGQRLPPIVKKLVVQ